MDVNLLVILGIMTVFAAGFIQGLTSFGFALIAMPFLAKVIPLQQIVPIVVILSLFTNIIVIINVRRHIDIKKIWILILFSLLAAPMGTYLLIYLNEPVLKILTGLLIVGFSTILLLGKSFPIRNEKLAFVSVGILSGLLNGSISMSGPPVALFLSNQNMGKEKFRANITAYAIILNVITISTYIYSGLLTKEVMIYTSWFIPSMLLGVLCGIKAIKKLDDQLFRRLALWLIIISGLWTLVNTLTSL
ncbi:sulfite exporter TauE/SafE family protein [Paenibacillus lemnae]|uniref:Probable membrane transporter protein n=1 Tax=Paenibacillus lemnae TaxID=1330551 RepID=A0A848MAR1_PAELE|nr:sulfite exporter TauE/SafE family protein [Paenibacillus lemnae]NMO98177.1 sulfite exporter TauE/SafE family protein [Paenibacillus lemnae]